MIMFGTMNFFNTLGGNAERNLAEVLNQAPELAFYNSDVVWRCEDDDNVFEQFDSRNTDGRYDIT